MAFSLCLGLSLETSKRRRWPDECRLSASGTDDEPLRWRVVTIGYLSLGLSMLGAGAGHWLSVAGPVDVGDSLWFVCRWWWPVVCARNQKGTRGGRR